MLIAVGRAEERSASFELIRLMRYALELRKTICLSFALHGGRVLYGDHRR